jgi:hypothetical protein
MEAREGGKGMEGKEEGAAPSLSQESIFSKKTISKKKTLALKETFYFQRNILAFSLALKKRLTLFLKAAL